MNQVGHFYIDANSAFSIFDLENGLKGLFVSGFRALVVTIVFKKKTCIMYILYGYLSSADDKYVLL